MRGKQYLSLLFILLFLGIDTSWGDPWCGYQQEPDKDPAVALERSWRACGEPTLPGPYGTPAVREDYAKDQGAEYMSLSEFFNNGMKTCYYAAHDGATSDQIDTCQQSYRTLQDQNGPGLQKPTGYDPFLMNR